MKKLLFLLCLCGLMSCTCLSQIPPQTIFVDENCQAVLPDFTLLDGLDVIDNCPEGTFIEQTPLPGTVLTFTTPTGTAERRAVDAFGNISDMVPVDWVLADSIKPQIIWNGGNIVYDDRAVPYLWQNILAHTDEAIAHFIYDRGWTQGLQLTDEAERGLWYFDFRHPLDSMKYERYVEYKISQEQ